MGVIVFQNIIKEVLDGLDMKMHSESLVILSFTKLGVALVRRLYMMPQSHLVLTITLVLRHLLMRIRA